MFLKGRSLTFNTLSPTFRPCVCQQENDGIDITVIDGILIQGEVGFIANVGSRCGKLIVNIDQQNEVILGRK